jgi:hypothetical protein
VPREDAPSKARRLLAEGRLTLRVLSEHMIEAKVRGDSALVYTTRWDRDGWTCTCEAPTPPGGRGERVKEALAARLGRSFAP